MKPAYIVVIVLAALALSALSVAIRAQRRQANRQPGARRSILKPAVSGSAILVGYWHDFVNAAGPLQLGSVSPQFDVINVAFARPVAGSTATIDFTVASFESKAQFMADVAALHQRGKKVVLSIGWAHRLGAVKNTDR